jgi:hypothetical protein
MLGCKMLKTLLAVHETVNVVVNKQLICMTGSMHIILLKVI